MITREQLKVGETYSCVINKSVKRTVKFIGNEFIVYDIQDNETKEEGWNNIKYFLFCNNLMPKPSNLIKKHENEFIEVKND